MLNDASSVRLAAVGDIMFGDSPPCFGFGVGSTLRKRGSGFPFEHVAETLRSADLRFGNLEAVLSAFDWNRTPFPQAIFRGQPEAVDGLRAAGFDVLNLANNHIMQHGRAGVLDTLAALEERSIVPVGVSVPEIGVKGSRILECKGLHLGFVAHNLRPEQYFLAPPLDCRGESDAILSEVAALRSNVDVVVVSLHWGDEFIARPSPEQVSLGRRIIDEGASLVIGHHSHMLQGMESYGSGLIAYSLGNFIFDMWQGPLRKTMALFVDLSRRGVERFDIVPAKINEVWQPVPLEDAARREAMSELDALAGEISEDPDGNSMYFREVQENYLRYRREIRSHYLRNLLRYPPARLLENLARIVRNRVPWARDSRSKGATP